MAVLYEDKLKKTKSIENTQEDNRMLSISFKALLRGSTLFFVIFDIYTFST